EKVFTNNDYEPAALKRDGQVEQLLKENNIKFTTHKDQVIFEKGEVLKDNGEPYTVFTPYKKKWLAKLTDFYISSYPSEHNLGNLYKVRPFRTIKLTDIGFETSTLDFPDKEYRQILGEYQKDRDFPFKNGTSRIGIHLRFGTLSIRKLVQDAVSYHSDTWLSELIWREFYFSILWHFPHTASQSFKKEYDNVEWRNNEDEFLAWCNGKT